METRKLTTKKGKAVETNLTDTGAIEILTQAWEDGNLGDFGRDLLAKDQRFGLSHDQMVWVHVLALEIKAKETEEPEAVEFVPEIVKLLERCRDNEIRWPKIRLQTEGGQKIVLSLAGKNAKVPGSVNITDGGKYGENVWFGRIEKNGAYRGSRANTAEVQDAVSRFNQDPAAGAKVHGALTGHCCFCGRVLETKESVGAGYGPVCAGRYGLPWGDTERYEEKKAAAIEVATVEDDTELDVDAEIVAIELGQAKITEAGEDARLDALLDDCGM